MQMADYVILPALAVVCLCVRMNMSSSFYQNLILNITFSSSILIGRGVCQKVFVSQQIYCLDDSISVSGNTWQENRAADSKLGIFWQSWKFKFGKNLN